MCKTQFLCPRITKLFAIELCVKALVIYGITTILEELTVSGYEERLRSLWTSYLQYQDSPQADQADLQGAAANHREAGMAAGGNTKVGNKEGGMLAGGKSGRQGGSRDAQGDKVLPRGVGGGGLGHGNQNIQDRVAAGDTVPDNAGQNDNDVKVVNDDEIVADDKDRVLEAGVNEDIGAVDGFQGRKLLSYPNSSYLRDSIERVKDNLFGPDKDLSDTTDTSFVDFVDIQPDTVRLQPWEKSSLLAELQQVCYIVLFKYIL